MNVQLIKANGSVAYAMADQGQIRDLLGAACVDKVNLGDGRLMFVDASPFPDRKPTNLLATDLCRQAHALDDGSRIVGDAAIVAGADAI
jgi:hypothetical protein